MNLAKGVQTRSVRLNESVLKTLGDWSRKMLFFGFGATDIGNQRERNEDAFLVENEAGWFAVADGVGGSAGGHIACKLAIEEFKQRMTDEGNGLTDESGQRVLRGINNAIVDYGLTHLSTPNLATTFTAFVIQNDHQGYLLHAGDSRLYGFHEERGLMPLTQEHTLANEKRKQGQDFVDVESENVLVNCMGNFSMTWTEYRQIDLANYDAFLICTDGLNKMVPQPRLEQIMRGSWREPKACVTRLIDMALQLGGFDNVTAIVIKRQ